MGGEATTKSDHTPSTPASGAGGQRAQDESRGVEGQRDKRVGVVEGRSQPLPLGAGGWCCWLS